MEKKVKVALLDDHALLRNGLAGLVTSLGHSVLFECSNGEEMIALLDENNLPDIILMDINMPEMDGYESTGWLHKNYPTVHVLAVTMLDDDNAVIRMLRNGAKGYILKNSSLNDLRTAIDAIMTKGFYYTDMVTGRMVHAIQHLDEEEDQQRELLNLTEREITFLKYACSEMTYTEIGQKMHVSPRTIDRYRDILFEKLGIKTRVGLVLFAIKNGIVNLN